MPSFQILTLGPPIIQPEAQYSLQTLRRRERALLFLLAASHSPLTREQIINLLWGWDADPRTARRALSVAISRIRQALPAGAVRREGDLYSLATDRRIFIDYRAFSDTVREILPRAEGIPHHLPLPATMLTPLLRAAQLWRGRFLEGFVPPKGAVEFEAWVEDKATALEADYLRLSRRLAWHFWVEHDLGLAIQFARQALTIDPQEHDLLLLVLRALHWDGRHAVARDFLAEMSALHKTKFGADYDEKVMRACQPYLKPSPYRHAQAPSATSQPPFVGYQHELQTVKKHLLNGGVWLITGLPGQGKSRFLEELSMQSGERWRTISATCHQGENHLPFAPLLEAFSKHVEHEEWQKVPQEWWPYLVSLFPEIELLLPPVILPKPSAALQVQFMEAMRQVLLVMTSEHPLLFTIDDLQWADLATLETIIYWMSRPPFAQPPLAAMVMTARAVSLEKHPFGTRLRPFLQSGRIKNLHLNGLSPEDVRTLAEKVAGRIFTPDEVASLWHLSMAGTPLYLLEVLRFQITTDNINKPVGQWKLPNTVLALLEARLNGLSPTALEVLEHIAVQGSEIPYHVLHLAVKQDEETLSAALDELLDSRWLEFRSSSGQDLYSFAHHTMREIIIKRIPPARFRLINARLARAWEEAMGERKSRKAAVIAYHYQQAAKPDAAFHWWIEAARYALSIGVAEQAHQAFQSAEQLLLDENSPFSDYQVWALYAEWQVLAADTLATDVLKHIAEQLQELARRRNSELLRGAALNAQAVLVSLTDNVAEEERLSRQAVEILSTEPDAEMAFAEACATLGGALSIQIKVRESLECLQKGLAALQGKERHVDAARALGSLHYQLAVAWTLAMEPKQALEHANASLEAYRRTHRVFGVAHALAARSLARLRLRHYSEALEDCKNARQQARLLKKWRLLGFINAYCAMIHMATGALKELGEIAATLQTSQTEGRALPRGAVYLIEGALGDAFLYLDDWKKAEEHYSRGLQFGGDLLAPGDILPRLAVAHAFLGKFDQAAEELNLAFSIYRRELGERKGFINVDEAILEYLRGDKQKVVQMLKSVLEDSALPIDARTTGYLVLARSQADLGDKAAAIHAANKAFQLAEQTEYYWMMIRSLAELATWEAITPSQRGYLKRLYQPLLPLLDDEFWGESVERFLRRYPLTPLNPTNQWGRLQA